MYPLPPPSVRLFVCGTADRGDDGAALSAVATLLPLLKRERGADVVVLNGENSAAGFGITPEIFRDFVVAGADVVTGGNHIWEQKNILDFLPDAPRLLLHAVHLVIPQRSSGAALDLRSPVPPDFP